MQIFGFGCNKSEYYRYEGIDFKFKKLEVADIDKLIKLMWKTLVENNKVVIDPPKVKEEKKGEEKKEEPPVEEKKEEKKVEETMTYEKFKLLFKYGKCDMSEENMGKLWKYTNKKNNKTKKTRFIKIKRKEDIQSYGYRKIN